MNPQLTLTLSDTITHKYVHSKHTVCYMLEVTDVEQQRSNQQTFNLPIKFAHNVKNMFCRKKAYASKPLKNIHDTLNMFWCSAVQIRTQTRLAEAACVIQLQKNCSIWVKRSACQRRDEAKTFKTISKLPRDSQKQLLRQVFRSQCIYQDLKALDKKKITTLHDMTA